MSQQVKDPADLPGALILPDNVGVELEVDTDDGVGPVVKVGVAIT